MDNNIKNKKIGKVYDFDGNAGTIVSADGIYPFHSKDLYDFNVHKGSEVEFYISKIKFGTETINVARFIVELKYNINKNDIKGSITK